MKLLAVAWVVGYKGVDIGCVLLSMCWPLLQAGLAHEVVPSQPCVHATPCRVRRSAVSSCCVLLLLKYSDWSESALCFFPAHVFFERISSVGGRWSEVCVSIDVGAPGSMPNHTPPFAPACPCTHFLPIPYHYLLFAPLFKMSLLGTWRDQPVTKTGSYAHKSWRTEYGDEYSEPQVRKT
jgi:hypothetical protein